MVPVEAKTTEGARSEMKGGSYTIQKAVVDVLGKGSSKEDGDTTYTLCVQKEAAGGRQGFGGPPSQTACCPKYRHIIPSHIARLGVCTPSPLSPPRGLTCLTAGGTKHAEKGEPCITGWLEK